MPRNTLESLLVCWFCLLTTVFAQDNYQPRIAEASRDAELALQGFQLPEGMSGKLLAAEPMLANPVAFYVANDGSLYVCETFRQEVGVEDNRNHMNWLDNDLQLQSVEERLAMFRRYMGDELGKWSAEQDRIRLLKDTNGDGTFDTDTVFAAGFNDPLDGTGAGVIELDGKVYYTCIPRLWKLEDTDADGIADQHEPLHHGYGVRVAFRGHDMHGLAQGPDGRIYYSIGDRGYNVIAKDGRRLHRPDTGAVFRCDPDGSHLEVFAYGLRNPQELAFDDYGNLFTGDNNSDSGDKARWVYIVQDSDSGWRMYFQYEDDRGPWNREHIWYPYQADEVTTAVQPAYTLPPVANLGDGPSGLTYYPGIGLPERYKGHFFMADFRGTAGNSGIRSFAVEPKGASFELVDSHQFIWSILGTDVDFAPDGSLYISDWVNGWVGEGKGRVYRFAHDKSISEVAGAGVPIMLASGLKNTGDAELTGLLAHADRRIRQQAQFELVRRNARSDLFALAGNASLPIVRRHAIWGTWQIGLQSAQDALEATEALAGILKVAADEDAVQILKVITDISARHGSDQAVSPDLRTQLRTRIVSLLKSDNLRVAGFAAAAIGVLGEAGDAYEVLQLLDRLNNSDPVVRHQAAIGLWKLSERNPGLLESHLRHTGDAGRLALAVALRRQQNPAIAAMLTDANMNVVAEAARAINDEPIPAAEAALAALAGTPGLPDLVQRRVLNANYRQGKVENAVAVAKIAADRNAVEAVRMMAANMLKTWNKPMTKDPVNGRWSPLITDSAGYRNVEGLSAAVKAYLPAMLAGSEKLRETSIEIASSLGITDIVPTLQQILADDHNPEPLRVSAFRALAKLSDDVESLLQAGRHDKSENIRMTSLEILVDQASGEAVPALAETLKTGTPSAQQRAIQLLGRVKTEASEELLLAAFQQQASGQLPAGATLDLIEAATTIGTSDLMSAVNQFRQRQQEAGNTLALWSECLTGGDAERGREIFFGRSAASCRRCHKVNNSGGEVGPDLSKIGKEKDRSYLLEAIVDPNAKIARDFETVIIITVEGKVHSGILKREDDMLVQLMTPQGALISIAKDDIDERANGQSGMPSDIAKNLTRGEIRDLVQYLSTLTTDGTGSHGDAGGEK